MRTISTCMREKLNRKRKAFVNKLLVWGTFAFFFIKGLVWLAVLFFSYHFVN